MKNLLVMLFFTALVPLSYGQEKEEKESHNFNPIIPDFVADPSVVMFGNTFYMYATTDINQGLNKMGIPVVWKSKDFVNWSFEGTIMPQIDWDKGYRIKDSKGKMRTRYFRYWAPGKPVMKDGKYYLFPTIVTPDEKLETFVVVADSPEGPFNFINGDNVYYGKVPQGKTQARCLVGDIDGEPFVDDNGEMYIYWRRRKAAKMKDDFSGIEGEVISVRTNHGGYSEGPVMFKRNNIYYYIYTLSGHANYCNGYMMSKEGPLGPFDVPQGESVFIYSNLDEKIWGPGHGNVFQMPGTDDFYFLYLEYGEGGTTRQVCVNKMEFNDDGTIVPMKLSKTGVGALVEEGDDRVNLAAQASVTASSYAPLKEVKTTIAPNPNKLERIGVRRVPGEDVARNFTYLPQNAVDNSFGTRWMAQESDSSKWLQVDLGAVQRVNALDIYFVHPTFGHKWTLEKSKDGKKWKEVIVQNEKVIRAPQIVTAIGKTRYLRLKITEGPAGIWDLKVY